MTVNGWLLLNRMVNTFRLDASAWRNLLHDGYPARNPAGASCEECHTDFATSADVVESRVIPVAGEDRLPLLSATLNVVQS